MPAKPTTPKKKPATAAKKAAVRKVRRKELKFNSVAEMRAFIAEEAESDKSYRMVGRPKEAPEPEPEPEAEAPSSAAGEWGSKPSVNRQLEVHPTSVRDKAPVSVQYVLSDAKQMAAWNKLQARMHPPQAPEVRLVSYRDEFSPASGTYILLVSYSELEYQQLV